MGVNILLENESGVRLQVGAGEPWDSIVEKAAHNGWWGMENLSHIPGTTGALAVQNVGAYGEEASQVIESVETLEINTATIKNFSKSDCRFSYRKSIFNGELKGRFIILNIVFQLKKDGVPNLSYKDLKQKFEGKSPSLSEIRDAVTQIRDTKFPYPIEAIKGNAGSFFKNPVLDAEALAALELLIKNNFGDAIAESLHKKITKGKAGAGKIPAAFLLDICGVKNMQVGGAAVNANQPLVIINQTGSATALDILTLAQQVQSIIRQKLGINLQFEPELVGFSQV